MIETAHTGTESVKTVPTPGNKKVLHWRKNERMGGFVPVWEKPSPSAKEAVTTTLAQAEKGAAPEKFETAMAYADTGQRSAHATAGEEFGFGDLVDMVNPLHHLPLVGHLYREITGDEIKPIAKIIGGGVFGGPAGAGIGLVDTVIEYETGQSMTGNVTAMITRGEMPQYRSAAADHPEKRLDIAAHAIDEDQSSLPGTVIGFADLGHGKQAVYERSTVADGRTAGTMIKKSTRIGAPQPIREPITQLHLAPFSFKLEKEME